MGTPDTIYIHPDVMAEFNPQCPVCGKVFKDLWQSKSLNGGDMSSYYLKYEQDSHSSIRLYALDGPDDRYWKEYTQQDIDEWNERVNNTWLKFSTRKPGDGYYTKEGFLPENRQARSMGELPHQWFNIHTSCRHEGETGWVDIDLKFTNGVVVEHTNKYNTFKKVI